MRRFFGFLLTAFVISAVFPPSADAEILAMMNYESKNPKTLKALKLSASEQREEGIAIVDVDPESKKFGHVLMKIPLPGDLVAHHIFYDRTMTKAYVSALGKSELHVIDMQKFPYRLKKIDVPRCKAGEDVIFAEDNQTWYLTCMGTSNIITGSVDTDQVTGTINTPHPYPHGLAVHQGIDRMLVTSTVRPSDLGDAGENVTVIEASTGEILKSHKMSNKPSPSREAPVEILFVPGATPPIAYVTNMYGGGLWTLTWNEARKDFDAAEAYHFSKIKAGMPLEIYFNKSVTRMYVTTAKPGQMHIFDIAGDVKKPILLKSFKTGEGAHHVALTKDERYAFVQNALLNLPGLSDGSVTVIDLNAEKVVASLDTLKQQGLNPNSIVLLPEWNSLAGH